MLLVLSHVDRLRPMQEWKPPYDLADEANPKAASIRAAIDAAGGDLGFSADDVVPACLDAKAGVYNVDAIWAEIMELMPEAQRAQLVRTLQDLDRGFDWRRLRTQALNAGRILAKAVLSGTAGKSDRNGSVRPNKLPRFKSKAHNHPQIRGTPFYPDFANQPP